MGVAFAVVVTVVVVGWLLVWVVKVVKVVYGLVLWVVHLPIRFFRYLDGLRRDIFRWACREVLWLTEPRTTSYRHGYTYATESSDGSSHTKAWIWTDEPGADDSFPEEMNTGSATGERQRASKPEHTRPPIAGQHASDRERFIPTGSAGFDSFERSRRQIRQVEKDLQD